LVLWKDSSVHVLNYNSPGATGALPMAALIASKLIQKDVVRTGGRPRSQWDATAVAERIGE
jgi:hypothetical protein